jgi:anion-transporting  ArsA/GET3 family ATPase
MKVGKTHMGEKNREKLNALSSNLLGIYVSDLFKKQKLREIPEEKKEQLRALVNDLKAQTDAFLEDMNTLKNVDNKKKTNSSTGTNESPLQSMVKKRREEKAKKAQEDTNPE